MLSWIWKWFTDRWPYYPLKRLVLEEEITGGASFFYTLGTSILIVFSLQVISGIVQLFYYVPTTDHAYDSVSYLRTQVPFGWLVHNVHYWGANAMVLLVALHMMRVYIWGAYKTQLTWLIGVTLLLATMALSFTGAPLIWDMKGYWAGEVGTSIAGTVPIVGGVQKTILRGGESMSQLTLSRFFVLHIGIFIPALILLIGMHIAAFRTTGVVGPWKEEKRRKKGPFWPDQAFKDLVVGTFVFFVLVTLCVFAPPPFTGPADPSNTTYLPKPEWNFLFLYEALKYFQGPLEPIGTAGVPAVLIALLVLLPFIDRSPERNPFRRPVAMACLLVYSGVILTLTVIGYLSPGYAQMPARQAESGQAVTETPGLQTVPSKPSGAKPDEEKPAPSEAQKPSVTKLEKTVPGVEGDIEQGKQLFHSLPCIQCHSVNGKGGSIGPALTHEQLEGKSREWLHDQIRDPKSHNPSSIMPAFKDLSDKQADALVDYLMSIAGTSAGVRSSTQASESLKKEQAEKSKPRQQETTAAVSQMTAPPSASAAEKIPGPAAYVIGDPENGVLLFQEQCTRCHGNEGKGGVPNPGSDDGTVPSLNPIDPALSDQNPQLFAEKIDRIIQSGSIPAGPHPVLHMPDWGDSHSLTQEQIANIEAYILSLNGVDRGKLIHPGMEPEHFFILTVVVFAAVIFLLGGLWVRKIRQACPGKYS